MGGGFLRTAQSRFDAQTLGPPVAGQITLGQGTFDRVPAGHVVEERFLSGTASRYGAAAPLGADGRWTLIAAEDAEFTTRLVIVRPDVASQFNGSVVVEWLNVSGGTDTAPDWTYLHRELVRGGYAYVGVSAQKGGLYEGAAALPGVLPAKIADPVRYDALQHPGDAYAFDIFSHAGKAVRHGSGLMAGLEVQRVIAVGESQSAGFLTTYVNGIDPLVRIFDGFLVHSRFAGAVPLDGAYVAGGGPQDQGLATMAVHIRSKVRVPVLTIITETDLMLPLRGYLAARQDDSGKVRTWEIAGTAHADSYILRGALLDYPEAPPESLAALYQPSSDLFGFPLDKPMNAAPSTITSRRRRRPRWTDGSGPGRRPRRSHASERPTAAMALSCTSMKTAMRSAVSVRRGWTFPPRGCRGWVSRCRDSHSSSGRPRPSLPRNCNISIPGGKPIISPASRRR